MKKMLKIMAMLLVIATVVFAAGCAEKSGTETEEGAEGDAEEATAEAPIAEENLTNNVTNVTENGTNETGVAASLPEELKGEMPAEEAAAEETPAEESTEAEETPAEDQPKL